MVVGAHSLGPAIIRLRLNAGERIGCSTREAKHTTNFWEEKAGGMVKAWRRLMSVLLVAVMLSLSIPDNVRAEPAFPLPPESLPAVLPVSLPHPILLLLLLVAAGVGGDNRLDPAIWLHDDEIAHLQASATLTEKMVAAGMGTRPECYAAHHIVAKNARYAEEGRRALAKWGIDLDDAENGVYLPQQKDDCGDGEAYHPRIHTRRYYVTVNSMLQRATSREQAIATLREIARLLSENKFPI